MTSATFDPSLRDQVLIACQNRGPDKTVCPSEIAREHLGASWRDHMPRVRDAAAWWMDRGRIVATRRGEVVDPTRPGGPIRLRIRGDDRCGATACGDLINIGPVCAADLSMVPIATLDDLRRHGATGAFEWVMVDKLHRGVRKNLFHAMYLYALWGALHDVNCMTLSASVRETLKDKAAAMRRDLMGD